MADEPDPVDAASEHLASLGTKRDSVVESLVRENRRLRERLTAETKALRDGYEAELRGADPKRRCPYCQAISTAYDKADPVAIIHWGIAHLRCVPPSVLAEALKERLHRPDLDGIAHKTEA